MTSYTNNVYINIYCSYLYMNWLPSLILTWNQKIWTISPKKESSPRNVHSVWCMKLRNTTVPKIMIFKKKTKSYKIQSNLSIFPSWILLFGGASPVFWISPVTGWLVQPHRHYCPQIQSPEVHQGNPLFSEARERQRRNDGLKIQSPLDDLVLSLPYKSPSAFYISGGKLGPLASNSMSGVRGQGTSKENPSISERLAMCHVLPPHLFCCRGTLTTVILNEYHTDTYIEYI